MNKLHELYELGQSVWLDYLHRSLLTSGELQELINQGLRGVTSNPTIFERAISDSDDYSEQMQELMTQGKSAQETYEALVIRDIQHAADLFRPVFRDQQAVDGFFQNYGLDGYVSLEANPHLANDTEATIEEIRRLRHEVNRPNVMFKVPATPACMPAIEQLISDGININITLMFSTRHYDHVAEAYMRGLEKRLDSGRSILNIASVASVFVSRVDSKLDPRLEEMGLDDIQGRIGVASAKQVYQRFMEVFISSRWKKLEAEGGQVQRVLWGSTGTKNPDYPDTFYVDNLIGAKTVNTVPPDTLEAFIDHGTAAYTIDRKLLEAHQQMSRLAKAGIDIAEIGDELQKEGVEKFSRSFDNLMQKITEKRQMIAASIIS